MDRTQIRATIDYERPGKQHGHLLVPYSYNLGGWANLHVPITVIAGAARRGPTALVLGGNHGDEYPGPIAILRLLRELRPEQVPGRLILMPFLNTPASHAATRLSPVDGKNMNRVFPGRADGAVTEMIAHYLTTVLFPLVDSVVDIHTGGRSMDFTPCSTMHLVADRDQRRKMAAAALAWNTDFSFLYADIAGTGLLPVEAERQGKIVVTTEMGGGEVVPARVHRICQDGLRNVLVHLGVLEGDVRTRHDLGLPPTRFLQALDAEDYRFAPESGLYENLIDPGEDVAAGQALGLVYSFERPEREPVEVTAASAGVLLGCRGPSRVAQGDCVACVAHEVTGEVLE